MLIGPSDALPGLQERLQPGADLRSFSESEALEALDHIIGTRPSVIALEHTFSTTARGVALISRIKDDATLTACEVRVVTDDGGTNRVAVPRGHGVPPETATAPLDQKGTRRAVRTRIKEGIEVAVDGNPAALIDLSAIGMHVVSQTVLKPNQRVRVTIGDAKSPVRCNGSVAWAAFEMPKGMATRYRAGINFGITGNAEALDSFAAKNAKPPG